MQKVGMDKPLAEKKKVGNDYIIYNIYSTYIL